MRSELESQFDGVVDSLVSVGIGIFEAIVVIVIARYLHHFVRDRLLSAF